MEQSSLENYTGTVSRFVVGIDLGTTNSSVSYIDTETDSELNQFQIEQLVGAGEIGRESLLPSFCYLPGSSELPGGATALPWASAPRQVVGTFARDQGAAIPGRSIASAKSWLAHAGVNRTRGILPWGSDLGEQNLSPVQVSSAYLEHIRQAWDRAFGTVKDHTGSPCLLAEQQIVLTVPASFDEVARELTLQAAREAGLQHIVLLEEPLAAFYAWLWRNQDDWQHLLAENETVLVVDVGGGTTDLSLIRVDPGYTLCRTAVGEHLLLGGDNMDMTLAREAEGAWGTKLDTQDWTMLCHQCRRAKERLLGDHAPEASDVAIAGRGSSIVASSRSHRFLRIPMLDRLLTGFFPELPADAPPPERRRGIREMGLPYAADPAVTRHLLHFLRSAVPDSHAGNLCIPNHILFNGGAMSPVPFRERICRLVAAWGNLDGPITELDADDLNLSVSRGAAYYGMVRRGIGVRVRGGTARAYYLEVGTETQAKLICVMPREVQEGVPQILHEPVFRLRANRPVAFPVYASATRLGDRLGDLLADKTDITPLPPLCTVLKYGAKADRDIPVTISSILTEIGTLEVSCQALDDKRRFPLHFDLRGTGDSDTSVITRTVQQASIDRASSAVEAAFTEAASRLRTLVSDLEEILELPRNEWNGALSRTLADVLIRRTELHAATARHEARWLNLLGYLVRPGFGAPADEWRMRELWKLWHPGPRHPNDAQVAAEWWVFWRRVAGGLRSGHQEQIASVLGKHLLSRNGNKLTPRGKGVQEAIEMWRCLGAMERLSVKSKHRILETLLDGVKRLEAHHFWVIARVGARRLLHGPADGIVTGERIETWMPSLVNAAATAGFTRMALLALLNTVRPCGLRNLDVSDEVRDTVRDLLQEHGAPKEWLAVLSGDTAADETLRNEIVGETLPLGLVLNE